MMQAIERLLRGLTGGSDQQARACQIASLPKRLGGLGMKWNLRPSALGVGKTAFATQRH